VIAGWRPPLPDERQLAWVAFAVSAAAVVLSPLARPLSHALPPCLLRQWTGAPCPTCGSTRAVLALVDGDLLGALAVNPLAAVAVAGALAAGIAAPWWFLAGGKVPRLSRGLRRGLVWAVVAAALANWIYLAVSGV
jgi:hypothetical protein